MNTHSGQQKPNLRRNKEGVKRIGRPAGSWEDDEKYPGKYRFEELEGESSKF